MTRRFITAYAGLLNAQTLLNKAAEAAADLELQLPPLNAPLVLQRTLLELAMPQVSFAFRVLIASQCRSWSTNFSCLALFAVSYVSSLVPCLQEYEEACACREWLFEVLHGNLELRMELLPYVW